MIVLGVLVSIVAFVGAIELTTRPQCVGFCSSAAVAVSGSSCIQSSTDLVCTLSVDNTGTANVYATGCSLTVGGSPPEDGSVSGTTSLAAGSVENQVICRAQGAAPPSGSTYTGSLSLSNGATVPFAGTWS